jgi:hypothetical protein
MQSAKGKTYRVVYEMQQSGGSTQTVTFEQSPPKSAILTSNGSVIDNGSQTLFCSDTSGSASCITMAGTSPLAAVTALFDPQQVLTTLQSFDSQVAEHLAGVTVTKSSRTIAGQPSSCVTVSASGGQGGTWCVTNQGVLAYSTVTPGGTALTLTSFSPTVQQSDFSPPAGATVETLPGGVTLPS